MVEWHIGSWDLFCSYNGQQLSLLIEWLTNTDKFLSLSREETLSEGRGQEGSTIIITSTQIKPMKAQKSSIVDNVSLYAALSRMDGHKSIKHTQGYQMLRQLSYAMQQKLAEGRVAYVSEDG